MKCTIYRIGLEVIDKPKLIERFDPKDINEIVQKLKLLQQDYCVDEKPKIINLDNRNYIECYSHSDFSHIALYKK